MIKFYIPLKISTNEIYSGKHWTTRSKHKQLFRNVPFVAKPVDKYPVKCHYHFVSTTKLLDLTNYSYMVKLIEDCLVTKGILKGDSVKFVDEIMITAEKGNEDYCEIWLK